MSNHLFYETSHSRSTADLVGYEGANDTIEFCFISNPYYPTPEMFDDLKENFPNLLKSYPSSNPMVSQKHLASVLNLKPENLILGNGATELIVAMNATLIDHIVVPIPTFGEYIETLRRQRDSELYELKADDNYQLVLSDYLAWARKHGLKSLLVINPMNPTGPLFSQVEMIYFLRRATDMELVVVDESFIDFAGDPVPSLLPLAAQYFVSLLAGTDADYHESRKHVIIDVRWLYNSLRAIPGIEAYPTGANLILFKIKSSKTAAELHRLLPKEHRMCVRDCSNTITMEKYHIRVASQGREKDGRLVVTLRELLI